MNCSPPRGLWAACRGCEMLQGLSPARGGHRPGLAACKGCGNFALAVYFRYLFYLFIYLFGTAFLHLFAPWAGRVGIRVFWRASIDFFLFFKIYFILLLLQVRQSGTVIMRLCHLMVEQQVCFGTGSGGRGHSGAAGDPPAVLDPWLLSFTQMLLQGHCSKPLCGF